MVVTKGRKKTLAIVNQKGGTRRTTASVNPVEELSKYKAKQK